MVQEHKLHFTRLCIHVQSKQVYLIIPCLHKTLGVHILHLYLEEICLHDLSRFTPLRF